MRLPLLALFLGASSPLAGQNKPIAPAPSPLFAAQVRAGSSTAPTDTLPKVGDHGVTGVVIGGLAGGAIGFLVAKGAFYEETVPYPEPGPDDGEVIVTSLVTIGSAAVGAWIGHRVGTSAPNGFGDHRVTGAVMGGVLGGVLGFLAGQQGKDPTVELAGAGGSTEVTGQVALTTISGAVLGAGLGYLMGRSTPKAGAR